MKQVILGIVLALVGTSAFARGPGGQLGCNCSELNRRTYGLNYVLSYARLDYREQQNIRSDVNLGNAILQQVRQLPYQQAEAQCSHGNEAVDRDWVRWQPWVATNGGDLGDACRW